MHSTDVMPAIKIIIIVIVKNLYLDKAPLYKYVLFFKILF